MPIQTTKGNFVVAGLNLASRKYFWNGLELTEVLAMNAHVDEDTNLVKLTVSNTTNFDAAYASMVAAGIKVKKEGN